MLHHKLYKSNCESERFIVLLHGFGGNCKVWKHQIPLLQEYRNVLTIDLPSHYDGNVKLTEMNGDIESIVAEIREVLDAYSIKDEIFMGVSLGTVFIKYLEHFYPQYVDRAILVGAVGGVGILTLLSAVVFSKVGDKVPFMPVYRTFCKVLMPWKGSKKARKVFYKCAKDLTASEFKAYMGVFKESYYFGKEYVKNSHKNNLYISGDRDFCFLDGIIKEANLTEARLIVFKKCGHICNIDEREQFNEVLQRAISECDQPQTTEWYTGEK